MSELKLPELFGSRVFNEETMKERLSGACYQAWKRCVTDGASLELAAANEIAGAMKTWAVERGCTHYTHWFQPMTGFTAEKHDSFIAPAEGGRVILEFSGKNLVRGEADASSFPSGGLRATHYARGYTAWDMTSPAFVKEMSCGTILCIPTIFVSYNGEALDKKTPLLRSMEAVSTQAVRILRLFGNTQATRVTPSVGAEQEYFLVDRDKYLKRRDLIYTGRTLFGAPAPKGQELDDQYFGVIRYRVGQFMADLNQELWKLGIPATTQHNEVAPAQHEMAPIYTMCNLAVDQNQLAMETMKRVATRHGLVCLLHEKPYAGVNGSGKHDNWSLTTNLGENLLDPGDTPNENLQFLLVLSCIIKAVDVHADLLRCSASNPGNEHRLGAQEAPPAIISIFLGDQLDSVVDQIVSNADSVQLLATTKLYSGVSTVPLIKKDATDRNRTSPFAFTGNRFEFRAVGSEANCASAMIALNAAVAEALNDFKSRVDALIAKGEDKISAIIDVVREDLKTCQPIHFDGNGYSDEWVEEAKRRGLDCETSCPVIFDRYLDESSVKMFESLNVMKRAELEARNEVKWETYTKKIQIEARVMGDLTMNHIIPVATHYQSQLLKNVTNMYEVFSKEEADALTARNKKIIKEIAERTQAIETGVEELVDARKVANKIEDERSKAVAYHDTVAPKMEEIRYQIDKLELVVSDELWTLPKYREMLFLR